MESFDDEKIAVDMVIDCVLGCVGDGSGRGDGRKSAPDVGRRSPDCRGDSRGRASEKAQRGRSGGRL